MTLDAELDKPSGLDTTNHTHVHSNSFKSSERSWRVAYKVEQSRVISCQERVKELSLDDCTHMWIIPSQSAFSSLDYRVLKTIVQQAFSYQESRPSDGDAASASKGHDTSHFPYSFSWLGPCCASTPS